VRVVWHRTVKSPCVADRRNPEVNPLDTRQLSSWNKGVFAKESMSITPEQINLWRNAPSENQRLEFKEAKAQYDFVKLCKYCVAIGNEGGGHLLFGVADKPPRQVVGTEAVNDPVGMAEKLFQALGFRVDVEAVNHPDGRIVVFQIPSRPKGTAYHLGGMYLMRSGEELVPMSEDQLRRIFAEGKEATAIACAHQEEFLNENFILGVGGRAAVQISLPDTVAV